MSRSPIRPGPEGRGRSRRDVVGPRGRRAGAAGRPDRGHNHDETTDNQETQCLTTAPYQGRPLGPSLVLRPRSSRAHDPASNNGFSERFSAALPPRATGGGTAAPMSHSLRLRDGERENQVSGSASVRAPGPRRPPAMWTASMARGRPGPPGSTFRPRRGARTGGRRACETACPRAHPAARTAAPAHRPRLSNGKHTSTRSTPDDKVLAVLKESTRPLAVAAIRKRPRRQLHAAAGPAHPGAERPKGHGHRRAPGHVPAALTSRRTLSKAEAQAICGLAAGEGGHSAQLVRSLVRAIQLSRSLSRCQIR